MTYEIACTPLAASPGASQTRFTYYRQGSNVQNAQYFPGDLQSVTDPNGVVTQFTDYDLAGNLKESKWTWTNPASPTAPPQTLVTTSEYDKNGRLISTVAPQATSTTQYDAAGRVETVSTLPAGPAQVARTTAYRYDARGLTVETTSPDGLVSRTAYDALGRVSWSEDPHLPRDFDHLDDAPGQIAGGTHTVYDALGRVKSTARYDRLAIAVSEGPDGLLSAAELPARRGSRLSLAENFYHPAGWLEEVQEADGAGAVYRTTHYEYDVVGRVTETRVTADGQTQKTRTAYDPTTGRRTSQSLLRDVVDGEEVWQTTRYEYDAAGNVAFTVFADGSFIHTEYDHRGLRIAQTDQLAKELRYDASGRERSAQWEAFTTHYHYDAQGRLERVELPAVDDPETASTELVRPVYEYEYDPYGNLNLIRDAKGRETAQTFDPFGRQLSRTLPENGDGITRRETWTYTPDALLDTHTDVMGQAMRNVYDSLGRIRESGYYVAGRTPPTDNATPDPTADDRMTFQLDALGRLYQVDDVVGTTIFAFDTLGRPVEVASPEGTIHYEFDPTTGDRTRTYTGLADPAHNSQSNDGKAVTDMRYYYDGFGRLVSATVVERNDIPLGASEITEYRYDLLGNLKQQRLPNQVVSEYIYDGLNRLGHLRTFRDDYASGVDWVFDEGQESLLAEFVYDLLPDGKRSGSTELNGAGQTTRIDWFYDGAGRLTREVYDSFDDALDYTTDYVLDLVGNRLQKLTDRQPTAERLMDYRSGAPMLPQGVDEAITLHYDALDRLLNETTDPADSPNDRFVVYGYGTNNANLQQSSRTAHTGLDSTGQVVARDTYTYNLQGRLSGVTVDSNGDAATNNVSEYEYAHDGVRVKETTNGNATLLLVDRHNPTGHSQVLEERQSGILVRAFTVGRDVIAQQSPAVHNGETFYYLKDGHGSTRGLVDALGLPLSDQIYRYDAFGNAIGFDPTATVSARLYNTEPFNAATNLYDFRDRPYDPRDGRFPSPDRHPGDTQLPWTLHRYQFVHGDGVNFNDPTGRFEGLAGLVANIGIGAAIGAFTSGGIAALRGGSWGNIGTSVYTGALSGAVGGGVGFAAGSLIGSAASGAGAGLLLTGILEIASGSIFAGAAVGMLDAYMDGGDIYQGAIEGALFGLILSPLYGVGAGATFKHAGQSGPGVQTGIGRKLLRTVWEDRATFNVSRDFFKQWRSVFGSQHGWSMEHMILKQRWYRDGTGRMNKILQGLGDSGVNQLLVPRAFNNWLNNHGAASALFNYGFYPTAFAGEYLLFQAASQFGETIADTIFGSDDE